MKCKTCERYMLPDDHLDDEPNADECVRCELKRLPGQIQQTKKILTDAMVTVIAMQKRVSKLTIWKNTR